MLAKSKRNQSITRNASQKSKSK